MILKCSPTQLCIFLNAVRQWAIVGHVHRWPYNYNAKKSENILHVIPRALGQRDSSKRSWDVKISWLKQPAGCSSWMPTGSLNAPRDSHSATVLPNGMVLVAGGFGPVGASAELYDTVNETWTPTDNLNTGRAQHTATLLPNGMVLVAGGFDINADVSASAELYDPASGAWTPTSSLNTARTSYTATLLPNGMVLVAGSYRRSRERGTLRSGKRDLDSDGQSKRSPNIPHGHLAAQRDGAGRGGIRH